GGRGAPGPRPPARRSGRAPRRGDRRRRSARLPPLLRRRPTRGGRLNQAARNLRPAIVVVRVLVLVVVLVLELGIEPLGRHPRCARVPDAEVGPERGSVAV